LNFLSFFGFSIAYRNIFHVYCSKSEIWKKQGVTPTPIQYICEKQRAVRLGKVCTLENPCESSMKNSIGKPYEGKLHVRFDEGGTDSLTNFIIFVEKKNYE